MSNVQKNLGNMTDEEFYAAMKALMDRGLKEGKIALAHLDALLEQLTMTPEEKGKLYDTVRQMGIDLTPEETGTPGERETAAAERMRKIAEEVLTLDTLNAREEEIIRLRFGLADGRTHSLEEVAQAFGVTRERIRMVENKIIRRHRGYPRRKKMIRDFYL